MTNGTLAITSARLLIGGEEVYAVGLPPINLAWVDACKSGVLEMPPSQECAEGFFFPYGSFDAGAGPFPEDRATCGYLIDVDVDRTNKVADVFFRSLSEGGA